MLEYKPIFPENLRAAPLSMNVQSKKIVEEAEEVLQAIECGESEERIIEETLDTIHACEGLLRHFSAEEIKAGVEFVYTKNKKRGDYL